MRQKEKLLFELSSGQPKVALVFPNTYQLAVSNLGYLWVWRLFNERGIGCERFVLPPSETFKRHATAESLRSLESGEKINQFPFIAFSLSYENDYINVVRALLLAGIPLQSRRRGKDDPFVFAGGAAITANPAPLSEIFDFTVLGEFEPITDIFCETLKTYRGHSRLGFLKRVSEIPGIYVPLIHRMPEQISDRQKINVQKFKAPFYAYSPLITTEDTFGGAFLIEIGRGCPSMCRFCLIGHLGLPPRYAELEAMTEILEKSGAKRVGLLSSNVSGHPEFNKLLAHLADKNVEVSVSSLRMGTKVNYELLTRAGLKQITLAPEAGSSRLRRVINKPFEDDEIISTCERALSAGIKRIKLYFLVGLPTESNEDAMSIATLLEKTREILGKGRRLLVSISPFVPKPHTPLELVPFAGEHEIKEKLNLLRSRLIKIANLDFEFGSVSEAMSQAYISRAGSEAAGVLIASIQTGRNIKQAALELGLNISKDVMRERASDEKRPWRFVNTRIKQEFLLDQYHLALEGRLGYKCKVGRCTVCGACHSK